MTITIDMRSNIEQIKKEMKGISKHVDKATSQAIDEVAEKIQKDIGREIKIKLHNPTAFTKKGTFRTYSNKNKKPISSTIGVKDIQAKYLTYAEHGGTSPAKGKAKPVPTKPAQNKAGNMPKGKVKKMLADKARFFSGKPKGGKRPGGIYQRLGTTKNKKSPKLRMIATWAKATRHSPRIRLGAVVAKRVTRDMLKTLRRKIDRAISK